MTSLSSPMDFCFFFSLIRLQITLHDKIVPVNCGPHQMWSFGLGPCLLGNLKQGSAIKRNPTLVVKGI